MEGLNKPMAHTSIGYIFPFIFFEVLFRTGIE